MLFASSASNDCECTNPRSYNTLAHKTERWVAAGTMAATRNVMAAAASAKAEAASRRPGGRGGSAFFVEGEGDAHKEIRGARSIVAGYTPHKYTLLLAHTRHYASVLR